MEHINVASVEHGLVTAIGAGTAVITAESQDGIWIYKSELQQCI